MAQIAFFRIRLTQPNLFSLPQPTIIVINENDPNDILIESYILLGDAYHRQQGTLTPKTRRSNDGALLDHFLARKGLFRHLELSFPSCWLHQACCLLPWQFALP